MKNLLVLITLLISITSCNQKTPTARTTHEGGCCNKPDTQTEVIAIDELFTNPDAYVGKHITIQGLCIHTCRNGGKKMFIQGTEEGHVLLITASESVSSFNHELEGTQIEASGVIVVAGCQHDHDADHHCVNDARTKNLQMTCSALKSAI